MKLTRKINIDIRIDKDRKYFCYRVGCNYFWLCATGESPLWGSSDNIKDCVGFIGKKENTSYEKFLIEEE